MKQEKKDYEQLYYDEVYKNKELIQKCKLLEEELEIYKYIQKNKNLKQVIVNIIRKYLNKGD